MLTAKSLVKNSFQINNNWTEWIFVKISEFLIYIYIQQLIVGFSYDNITISKSIQKQCNNHTSIYHSNVSGKILKQ